MQTYTALKVQIKELTDWFDEFLGDKSRGGKLDLDELDSNLWQEYNSKYKMYMKIRDKIETIERKFISAHSSVG